MSTDLEKLIGNRPATHMTERLTPEQLRQHARTAAAGVESWPLWKKTVLKGAMRVVGDNAVKKPDIFTDIQREMDRQVQKWGKQSHPMVPRKGYGGWGYTPDHFRTCADYECPTADRAKFICDSSAKQERLTYFHILLEEVCEAIEAANVYGDYSSELRTELVQVGAVTASMIQLIDEGDPNESR